MSTQRTIDGYVADSLYPSNHHAQFQPVWIDAALVHRGVQPPRRSREPFTLVDLGCGDGVGLIIAAVAHPEAKFIGVDAMPEHIARGRALVQRVGVPNIELIQATFDVALQRPAVAADYVSCQGVLSWVSPDNQRALLALASRWLRPGGVLAMGYNCMPAWTPLIAFQRLVGAIAETLVGTPAERFAAAFGQVRASGAVAANVFEFFDARMAGLPTDYFAHEYLNAHWQPMWSGDVHAAAQGEGLKYVGEASAAQLRPDFALRRAWREALDKIESPRARSLALDLFVERWFRVDVFSKGSSARLSDDEVEARRLKQWWAVGVAMEDAVFECKTAAGTLKFDNDAARAIVSHLQQGPAMLGSVAGIEAADLLNTIDALWMANLAIPVEAPTEAPHARTLNAVIADRSSDAWRVNALVGRHGAVGIPTQRVGEPLGGATLRRLGIDV